MNKRPILVAFSNQKGGVGKSTVTAVLASYFNYVRGLKAFWNNVLTHHLEIYSEELGELFRRKTPKYSDGRTDIPVCPDCMHHLSALQRV